MIKLRVRLDISFGKLILGVASISASVCTFQFLISKSVKQKPHSANDTKLNGDKKGGRELKKHKQHSEENSLKPTGNAEQCENKPTDSKVEKKANGTIYDKTCSNDSNKENFSNKQISNTEHGPSVKTSSELPNNHKNKESQNKARKEKIDTFDQDKMSGGKEASSINKLTGETDTKDLKKYPQENIQDIKLSHELLKHQFFFDEVLSYVSIEKRALSKNLEQLTTGILNDSLY